MEVCKNQCIINNGFTDFKSGSVKNSRSSIPSVMYCITVFLLVQFSKRMEYPTSLPTRTFISSATREATDMAATRLG